MMQGQVYTVSNVNRYIGRMFEQNPALDRIRVKGEVTDCKYHTSGHVYFTLKDEASVLSVALFSRYRAGLRFRLQNGMSVVVSGSVQVYAARGAYQLVATQVEPDGIGALYEQFERLKRELDALGYFADSRKKPVPPHVQVLGIVTSPSGDALRDILRVTRERNPHVEFLFYPCQVEGAGAAESICRGIRALDGLCDCMIVGRGGGSYESLQAFNERCVADAVFACRTPVVSGVGHEPDITIIDLVADVRGSTPSNAAEKASYRYKDFTDLLDDRRKRLNRRMGMALDRAADRSQHAQDRLKLLHPARRIGDRRQRLVRSREKLSDRMERLLEKRRRALETAEDLPGLMTALCGDRRHRLEVAGGKLAGFAPERRLAEGFAFVTDREGKPVAGVRSLSPGDPLRLLFADGAAQARTISVEERSGARKG